METYNISLYSLTNLNKDIDIRANLLNKKWRVFNDSDVKETCTFNEDGSLTIVKDGIETTMPWKIKGSKIKIGREKLYPSYKDNIIFAFHVPEQGNVFFIDEQNKLSIIPTTKQDLYDYFQKAELAYLRFCYPVSYSKTPLSWYIIWSLVSIIGLLIAWLLCYCDLAQRILVEFGIDNNFNLSFAIIVIVTLLGGLIIQNIANNYNLTQNIQNERDLTKSRKKWIENNSHDKRWLQYGYSLFIYCPYGRNTQRRLRARWNYGDINSEYIGFYDKKIETRDQLLKVDYEIGELRKGICKRISRLSWGIIYSIIGLVSFGIVYSICQVLPPVFKEIDGIWAVILLFMLFCAIAVGLWQFLDLVIVPHVEYIRDCYRIRRWITENPTDWRKEYILFINYSDYKTWREL